MDFEKRGWRLIEVTEVTELSQATEVNESILSQISGRRTTKNPVAL